MDTTPQAMHATTIDWQEEVYQKIKALKDLYFDDLNDLYQKLTLKCQQQEALGQTQMQSEQIDKLRNYRNVLKSILIYLTIPKNGISPGFKDKIGSFEKQILFVVNLFKARKPAQNQQGQQQQLPPPSGGQSLSVQQQQQQQQQHQPQPQISQLQHNENHASQLPSVNLQNSLNSMQSSTLATMQHGSMSLGQDTGIPSSQQNLLNTRYSRSHMDSTQASNLGTLQPNTVNSLSHCGAGSWQQNTVNASQPSTLISLPHTMQQTNQHILQTTSPLISQHASPQVDQQSLLAVTSVPLVGTTGTILPSDVSQGSTLPGQGDQQNTPSVSQTQNQGRLYEDMASPQQHQQQPKRHKRSSSHVMGKGKKRRMSRAVDEEILCSICWDPVTDNGDRSTAKLRCSHQFHLDCISSWFNAKASMQCPICRRVENGQWLFSEKNHAFSDSDEDDWEEDD